MKRTTSLSLMILLFVFAGSGFLFFYLGSSPQKTPEKSSCPFTPSEDALPRIIRLNVLPAMAAAGAFLTVVGVPFPSGAGWQDALLTTDQGEPVACQQRVAARHTDGSPRWVHLTFVTRSGVETYELRRLDNPAKPSASPHSEIHVRELADAFEVETGGTIFVLSKSGFEPFRRVVRNGNVVLGGESKGGLFLQGRFVSSRSTAVIEERGPVCVRIAYVGKLLDAKGEEGCSFSARLYFAAGLPCVWLDITLYQDTEAVFLDLSEFSLRLPLRDARTATFYPNSAHFQAVSLPVAYRQHAKRLDDRRWTYPWETTTLQTLIARGERGQGAGIVRLASGATLEFAVQDFWQNAPKSVEISETELRFGLYPSGEPPLAMHVGTAKTHRLFLNFPVASSETPTPSTRAFLAKARAFPTTEWYAHCGEPVRLAPRCPKQFAGFEQLAEQWIEDIFVLQREAYGEYGWLDFGDFRHGMCEGYWNNNETLLDHGLFVQFARTGDKRYFDWGEETLRHYQDIDLRHHTPRAFDYGILMGPGIDRETARRWGEKGKAELKKTFVFFGSSFDEYATFTHGYDHFGRKTAGVKDGKYYCGGSMNEGHCFMLGHLTYYYMTGDAHSLDMARRVGNALLKKFRSKTWGRATGMPTLFLLELYAATGERKYLNRAREAINFWTTHPDLNTGNYLYVVTRALARYIALTGDETGTARRLFLAKVRREVETQYVAGDGLRHDVLRPVQAHADARFYTQLADLADAARFLGDPAYVEHGISTFECLVENHAFDSVALSAAAPFMDACLRRGRAAVARDLSDLFEYRYPDIKFFHFRKEAGRELEIRLYTDSGFRTSQDNELEGRIVLSGPDGKSVREQKVDQLGYYAYVFSLPPEMPGGDYCAKVLAIRRNKNQTNRIDQILWNAWSSNGKVVAEAVKNFLPIQQKRLYFEVPAGCRRFSIRLRPLLPGNTFTLAYQLHAPDGRLVETAVYPANGKTERVVCVDPVPADAAGIWQLRLPFGKNFITFEGIPPFCAMSPEGYFRPTYITNPSGEGNEAGF